MIEKKINMFIKIENYTVIVFKVIASSFSKVIIPCFAIHRLSWWNALTQHPFAGLMELKENATVYPPSLSRLKQMPWRMFRNTIVDPFTLTGRWGMATCWDKVHVQKMERGRHAGPGRAKDMQDSTGYGGLKQSKYYSTARRWNMWRNGRGSQTGKGGWEEITNNF